MLTVASVKQIVTLRPTILIPLIYLNKQSDAIFSNK